VTDTDRHATGGAIDHEIDSRSILKIGLWLAIVTIAGFVIAWAVYRGLASLAAEADPAPSPIAAARTETLPPAVQLAPRPENELAAYRREVDERLASWGWVDRDANIAHVPIERAIELVAADAAPAPDAPTEEVEGTE
jgi:hypothetical protein